ncbi:MAG: hypothetical protein KAH98_04690 [Dehalococcoidia bacterium]|nr:hypothetical protein [Dehalococcoidia bacterium]
MKGKEAIMAAIDRFEEETMAAPVVPRRGMSYWRYWGLADMMRMRILWQLRIYPRLPL